MHTPKGRQLAVAEDEDTAASQASVPKLSSTYVDPAAYAALGGGEHEAPQTGYPRDFTRVIYAGVVPGGKEESPCPRIKQEVSETPPTPSRPPPLPTPPFMGEWGVTSWSRRPYLRLVCGGFMQVFAWFNYGPKLAQWPPQHSRDTCFPTKRIAIAGIETCTAPGNCKVSPPSSRTHRLLHRRLEALGNCTVSHTGV